MLLISFFIISLSRSV